MNDNFFQEDQITVNLQKLFSQVKGASLIHADPPWTYRNKKTLCGVSNPEDNQIYDTLKISDIVRHVDQAFDSAAENARLILWVTWPLLIEWHEATQKQAFRWEYKTGGCWHKAGGVGVGVHWRGRSEPVLIYVKGKPHNDIKLILKNSHNSRPEQHSVKPVLWIERMIRKWTVEGDLVFDLYAGLAPVALACLNTGRRYEGAEIDTERHQMAIARMKDRAENL